MCLAQSTWNKFHLQFFYAVNQENKSLSWTVTTCIYQCSIIIVSYFTQFLLLTWSFLGKNWTTTICSAVKFHYIFMFRTHRVPKLCFKISPITHNVVVQMSLCLAVNCPWHTHTQKWKIKIRLCFSFILKSNFEATYSWSFDSQLSLVFWCFVNFTMFPLLTFVRWLVNHHR